MPNYPDIYKKNHYQVSVSSLKGSSHGFRVSDWFDLLLHAISTEPLGILHSFLLWSPAPKQSPARYYAAIAHRFPTGRLHTQTGSDIFGSVQCTFFLCVCHLNFRRISHENILQLSTPDYTVNNRANYTPTSLQTLSHVTSLYATATLFSLRDGNGFAVAVIIMH